MKRLAIISAGVVCAVLFAEIEVDHSTTPPTYRTIGTKKSSGYSNALEGKVFDFSDIKGLYVAVSNVVDALGGTVKNFPTFQE